MFIFILISILFLVLLMIKKDKNIENFESSNICAKNLSDTEYLKHMIPHHQVAIDISIQLQKISKNSSMHNILRKLIWTQKYEIELMKRILKEQSKNLSKIDFNTFYDSTTTDYIKPNKLGLTNTYCDLLFFNPKKHNDHLGHMKLDDIMYIEHMIPHHQVAVDMSKVLLQNTKNDFMIYLAYRIIRSQQEEIILLNDFKDNIYNNKSELII